MSLKRALRRYGLRRNRLQPGDFVKLGSDACEVIAARTAQGMTGTLSAAEAHRMVAEKQAAAVKACFTFAKYAMKGEINAASASSFNVFQKAVSANRRRLRRRRWWS